MNLQLKPFEPADIEYLVKWIPDESAMVQWSGPYFTWPLSRAALSEYQQSGLIQPPIRRIFKAVAADSGAVLGHIELNNLDFRSFSATLSRVLVNPSQRGQGIGLAMTLATLQVAFDQLHLHRVNLHVYDFNQPAIHCYERAGFRREGYLRQQMKVGNGYWNTWAMAILEDEWRALHPAEESE